MRNTRFRKKRRKLVVGTTAIIALATIGIYVASAGAQTSRYPNVRFGPKFDSAGALLQPQGFRTWVFLGAPLTPNALNGGSAGFPEYHNVYVEPAAFERFRRTGEWPEGTMMVKELQLVKKGDSENGSRLEPSGQGYFPAQVNGLDVSVKDSKRFAGTNNWGFFNFSHHAPPYLAAAREAPAESCANCHIASAHKDMVFVDFYKAILDPLPQP